MAYKIGRTPRPWLRLVPCMAIALSDLILILIIPDSAQAQATFEETTTTATIHVTTTATLSLTRTQTISTQTTASAAPGEMMDGDQEYLLQGCYGQDGLDDVGTMLGVNYTTPSTTTGAGNMTLPTCLKLCGSSTDTNQQPCPYAGISDGKDCYCGTSLDPAARQAHPEDCAVPCEGNATLACGGHSFMLIYKLTAPADNPRDETAADNSTTTTTSPTPGGIDGGDKGARRSSPGTTAAVAMGSISGFVVLLFVLFLGARRRMTRQRRAAGGGGDHDHDVRSSTGTDTNDDDTAAQARGLTADAGREAGARDAAKGELRRLDGIVMDGQLSPTGGRRSSSGRRPSYAGRAGEIIIAAATGAEWRNASASPVTPRGAGSGGMGMGTGTPKRLVARPEDATRDDILPHTPSAPVQHPGSVAQGHGLGERAWNRRRLSTPFPPAGYTYEGADDDDAEQGGERRASVSLLPRASGDGARVAGLRAMGSMIPPPPLDMPMSGRDIDDSLAVSGEDGALLSPRWTMWTQWSLPSTSPVSGPVVGNANTGEKAGKTE